MLYPLETDGEVSTRDKRSVMFLVHCTSDIVFLHFEDMLSPLETNREVLYRGQK